MEPTFLSLILRTTQIDQHLLEERVLVGMHVAIGRFVQVLLQIRLRSAAHLPHYLVFKLEPPPLDALRVCARMWIHEMLLVIHLEVPISVLREFICRPFVGMNY